MSPRQRNQERDTPSEWDDLAARSQAGSHGDYHQLLTKLVPVLTAYFRRNFATAAQAEDLMQETLLALHRKFHTYDSSQPFLPWLFAVARYKAIDHIRYTSRQVPTTPLPDDEALLGNAIATTVQQDTHEASAELEAALCQLSPRDRQLIELVKLQEHSLKTVGEMMQLNLSAVKVGLFRALKRLKAVMPKAEGSE